MASLPASLQTALRAAVGALAIGGLPAFAAEPAPADAARLGFELGHMDAKVRPQDDFYRHVNGGWLSTTQIPADRARYGTFIELADKSEVAIRAIIEKAAASPSKAGSNERKIGDLFRAYMDLEAREKAGLSPIKKELERVAKLESKLELPKLFAEFERQGISTPFGSFVNQDAKMASRYVLYVSQSGLGMPDRDYYFNEAPRFVEVRAAYVTYLEKVLAAAGVANPKAAAKDVLKFETQLAKAQWDRVKNRDREATYNPRTVAELGALTPGFDWNTYLKSVGASKTPTIVVRQPDYLTAVSTVLRDTPMPTLRNYFAAKVVSNAAPYLTRELDEANFAFYGKTLTGAQEQRPQWKRGVAVVNDVLGEAVGKIYVAEHFSPASKTRMQELVKNLIVAFDESIDTLEWMGPETKKQAKEKLARFNVKIGYPDTWRSYTALKISATDLMGNLRNASAFEHNRMVGRLGKPIDRAEWRMTPQQVNAYYLSTMNEIVFPAAILQPPFFNPAADDAVNYGAIGAVIGHEISHGFDDQGSRSDGEGNLRNWWTTADRDAFQARTGQLTAQYDGYSPIEGMNVNGKLTLGENIGDLSGLTVAYRAYQKSLEGKAAPVIAGYTGPQRFFMGWGQIWRGLLRDDYLRQQLTTDPHSPGEYRVNGVVRNMPEFHEAFEVTEKDRNWMPVDQRVKIW